MAATRLIITAWDLDLAAHAAMEFCGNASSVIGCDAECGIEQFLTESDTPDGRPGIAVLAFAFSRSALETAVTNRVGQNVLTCPTTACYSGLAARDRKDRIRVGGRLRFFGDGFQSSRMIGATRYWRIPVMDGEFLCEDAFGTVQGVGGGNLLICGRSQSEAIAAARCAVRNISDLEDVILPFPSGFVRSGSKVGSKYSRLKASTSHRWCPTLTARTDTALQAGENAVYEIVIDGLTETAVARAMRVGRDAAAGCPGILRVSAGNYGGQLGPYHFHLKRLEEQES